MARGLKFRIKEVEGLYNVCSENKDAERLISCAVIKKYRKNQHDRLFLLLSIDSHSDMSLVRRKLENLKFV